MAISLKSTKPAPAGCLVFLGLLFLIGGLCMLWFLGVKPAARAREVRGWDVVPCVVKKAELTVSLAGAEPVVEPDVVFEYSAGGQARTGTVVEDSVIKETKHANDLEEVLAGYRAAPSRKCLVNPQNPAEAVLEKPTYWGAIAFGAGGLVFTLVGLLMMLSPMLRRGGGGKSGCALLVVPVICLVFAGVGGTCLWLAAKDNWKEVGARMKEAPCKVLHSRVEAKTSSSRKGGSKTTYHAEILFSYEWEGRTWHSEWPDFTKRSSSSSSRSDADNMVRRHPVGAEQKCWVDPQQPWVAVLEKSQGIAWLLWIIGGIFGGIGVLGLLGFLIKVVFVGSQLRKPKASVPPPLPPEMPS